MNFHAFSGLLNGLAATISGIIVYAKNPTDPKHQAYGMYALAAAIWGYGYWAWQISSSHDSALFYVRLLMVGAIFLPVAYLWHVLTLLDNIRGKRPLLWLVTGIGLLFFLLNLTPYFVAEVQPAGGFRFWPQPGPVFHLYLLWFGLCSLYGTWLLFQGARSKSGAERYRFYLLAFGSIVAYGGGMTTFPLWYGINIQPHGAILLTVYTSVVAYTLLRYRLLDLGTALERGVTGSLLVLLVAFPAYPALLLGQQWYLGSINIGYSLVELLVLLLLVFGASSLKTQATTFITKALFKERYDQYKTVLNFSKSLVSILELKDLTSTIVQSICPTLGLQWGGLYLRKAGGKDYDPISSFGKPLTYFPSLQLGPGSSLEDRWRQGTNCFVGDELRESLTDDESQSVITTLATIGTEVYLPLVNKNRILGFCVFGPTVNSGGGYTSQELELLATLSQEASIALDNALLYEELKRSQSLVRRTDRLRSLETMAGGLAHEIRNPLTSIKAFVDLAPERKDDEQFLARFSKVVKEDVFRIERLTREILDYAKPMEPHLREEDLNDIVESCLYTLRVRPSHELIVIETDLVKGLPKIFADRQKLKQVILNFLFNAVEAMLPDGGTLTVRTRDLKSHGKPNWVQVEIQDAGSGIAPEDIDHIFDPFFTTKHLSQEHEGTGLGLAIAHQIIQEHQGQIEVQSVKGRGTTFFVNLPMAETQISHPSIVSEAPTPTPEES
ncbi:MAG: GAF domain-containing protein [Nitrospirota bacterium]|nr:MAG: GAF domain-containing protein [Nitrospirota bacterium]